MATVPVELAAVDACRASAAEIADDVQRYIDRHTTVGVERTIVRAYGVDGADDEGTPLVNTRSIASTRTGLAGRGVAYFLGRALLEGAGSVQEAAETLAYGSAPLAGEDDCPGAPPPPRRGALARATGEALARIDQARGRARDLQGRLPRGAARRSSTSSSPPATSTTTPSRPRPPRFAGADIVAVIRATAQSLLDYVPHGATTEGYGGTFATQENFKIIRRASTRRS